MFGLRLFKRTPKLTTEIRSFIQGMSKTAPFTPDISEIEESEFKIFFIYDDLMFAAKNYDVIRENSAKLERGFTRHKFNLYSDGNAGAVPLLGRKTSAKTPRMIKGELHAVESSFIPKLDERYRNGVYFRRIRVPVLVPYRDYDEINNGMKDATGRPLPPAIQGHHYKISSAKVCVLRAEMYIGLANHWNQHLDGGYNHPEIPFHTPENSDHPWLESFYKFPKKNEDS